jgi:hypothetical protein
LAVNGYILEPVWAARFAHSTLYTPFKLACHRIKAVVYYGGNTRRIRDGSCSYAC